MKVKMNDNGNKKAATFSADDGNSQNEKLFAINFSLFGSFPLFYFSTRRQEKLTKKLHVW